VIKAAAAAAAMGKGLWVSFIGGLQKLWPIVKFAFSVPNSTIQ
jgi:hypothetical protein